MLFNIVIIILLILNTLLNSFYTVTFIELKGECVLLATYTVVSISDELYLEFFVTTFCLYG